MVMLEKEEARLNKLDEKQVDIVCISEKRRLDHVATF